MRTVLAFVVGAALGAIGGSTYVTQRSVTPVRAVEASPKATPASAGAWRASNGVVLNAADVARLEEQKRESDKYVAELEYLLKDNGSKWRAKPGPVTSVKPDRVPPKPQR